MRITASVLCVAASVLCVAASVLCVAALAVTAFAQNASQTDAQVKAQMTSVENYLRTLYAWGSDYQVKAGPPAPSVSPQFLEVPVQVTFNGDTSSGTMYVSKDGKYMVRGDILDLNANPFADVLGKIHLQGSPSKGPTDAKVTVVDYSDYECPHCRELYMVEKEIIQPKYPQVRFVTKNFPLVEIHPWAMTAAIAAHCAFEHSNEAFWKVHDTIFDDQDLITPDNATDKLVEILGTAGVPADAAKMCLAAPGSKNAVEADLAEAKSLGANSTPTVFINGRELVGGDASTLQRYIDYDLTNHQN